LIAGEMFPVTFFYKLDKRFAIFIDKEKVLDILHFQTWPKGQPKKRTPTLAVVHYSRLSLLPYSM
jgi:hypothetical protein